MRRILLAIDHRTDQVEVSPCSPSPASTRGLSSCSIRREAVRVAGTGDAEAVVQELRAAELLAYLPIVTRVNSLTIRFVGKDIVEVSRFIEFVGSCSPDITPESRRSSAVVPRATSSARTPTGSCPALPSPTRPAPTTAAEYKQDD